ncbi:MAG: hypothetical protein JAY94_04435 [Candidatus Thiodiazotropha endolucinida]|nr:hypothetical protein [Candidatus Thiodiazotropha taylori]MCW4316738.1 hypothetical protein [Candidatus Thiodiazotropha taylori]
MDDTTKGRISEPGVGDRKADNEGLRWIDFAIFTFAKSSGINDTMFRLLNVRMPIQGFFDSRQGAQDCSLVKAIAQ